jgi:MFS family permease
MPFHYAWVIVAGGTLTTFAALGLGRFALGMLLPAMSADLHLGYARMGWVGTANFVGYLIAVLASGMVAARVGRAGWSPRRCCSPGPRWSGSAAPAPRRAGCAVLLTGRAAARAADDAARRRVVRQPGGARVIVSGSGFAIPLAGWFVRFSISGRGRGVAQQLAGHRRGRNGVAATTRRSCDRPADLGLAPHGDAAAYLPPAH